MFCNWQKTFSLFQILKKNGNVPFCSFSLANNEDAHEKNHDEENPHEESVHHLGYLLPFSHLGTRGPLLSKTVRDVFHVANQFRVHVRYSTAIATEYAGAKRCGGDLRGRFYVFGAAQRLLVFRRNFLIFWAVVARWDSPNRDFKLSRCEAVQVAALFPGDVMVDFHLVLLPGGLRLEVFMVLMTLLASGFAICLKVGVDFLVTRILLEAARRRGGARSTVLSHFIHEENLGHVVDDEHFSPVWNRFGLSTTEVNVHDEDGESSGGCDHGHGGYIVLPCAANQQKKIKRFVIRKLRRDSSLLLFFF